MTAWSRWFILHFNRYFCYEYMKKDININNKNIFDINKHYEIIKKVRNHYYLDLEELDFIKTCSKEQLIEFIEIINVNTIRMNQLINDIE